VTEHRPEVADVFRQHGQEFLERWGHALSWQQVKALRDIGACQTWLLGAHVKQCDSCSHRTTAFDSCRNRHCPKCQSTDRDKWLARTSTELLSAPYSHVVFTLPQQLAPLALQNPRVIYHLLFTAAAETLITIAADRKRLGARIGFLAVLHTWNQQVMHHPHLHCLVPAGGISPDGSRWLRCRLKYFLPVKVLGKMFRGKFLDLVREAYARGKLRFLGSTKPLADRVSFDRFTMQLKEIKWVVYAKPPLDGPEHVIKYLARYTHRVAIANGRMVEFADGRVTFRWRDSRDGNKQKLMTLDAVEFIRRYLLHVLPCGFVKIRRFGFLANRNRRASLALCRTLLGSRPAPVQPITPERHRAIERRCPLCHEGRMVVIEHITARDFTRVGAAPQIDTS
jgi:hypothetical protein